MCIWGHCPAWTLNFVQLSPSCWWFRNIMKNSEVVHHLLLRHDFICFVKCRNSTGSKTAPRHDATTTIISSWYSVLAVYSSKHTSFQNLSTKRFFPCLSAATCSRAWMCWFCKACLTGLPLVFEQPPVHGKSVPCWFLGCSWSSEPIYSQLEGTDWNRLPDKHLLKNLY